MSKHTPGPWVVIERRHPYKDGSKAHIERNIYTEWDHPQLRGKYPIACVSVGIGMDGEKAVKFVHIDEANARLISAAPDLLEALRDFSEYVRAEQSSTDGQVHYSNTQINRLVFKARAAIAKATA